MVQRTVRLAGLVMIASLLAAACGGGSEGTSSGGASGSSTTQDTVAAADLDPDATLTWSYAVPPRAIDPARSASAFDAAYLRPAYDTLIRRDENNALQPGLATEWTFVDESTLELTLQEGVTFHDGEPFDAEAVKKNLERTKTLEGGTQQSALAGVDSVEVVDPTTVHLKISSGAAVVPGVLTSFAGMMISPAAIDGGVDLNTTAVGTGPYRMVDYDPAAAVGYERFEESWEPGAAGAAELTIIIQTDAGQRLNQVRTGQADMTHIDANLVAEAEAAGLQVQAKTSDNVWYVAMNNTRSPFDTPEARRAVNLAIDRDSLVQALDFGYGTPSSQLIPEGLPGHNADVTPTFDVDAAKKALADAGVEGATVRLLIQAIPTYTSFQQALEQMLTEVGFKVEPVTVETAQIATELLKGEWDLYIGFFPGAADPWITYNTLLGPGTQANPGDVPASVSDLMLQVSNEVDPDARAELLEQLAAAVDEESLIAVLSHPQRPTTATQEVVNFNGNVHAIPEFRTTGKREA